MEVQRGTCITCSEANRVFSIEDSEQFIKILTKIFEFNLTEYKTLKINWKICPNCSYKLTEIEQLHKQNKNKKSQDKNCVCCSEKKSDLIKISSDWKWFMERVQHLPNIKSLKQISVCNKCFFCLDTAFNIRKKLFEKYPKLKSILIPLSPKKSSPTSSTTNNRRSTNKNGRTSSNKNTVCVPSSLNHLKSLINTNYKVKKDLRTDDFLYRKIAFVNLSKKINQQRSNNKFKIKLKPKVSKSNKKVTKKNNKERIIDEDDDDDGEIINRKNKRNNRKKNHKKIIDEGEEEEESHVEYNSTKITKPTRKRRASTDVDLDDGESTDDNSGDDSSKNKLPKQSSVDSNELKSIVGKYTDSKFDDNSSDDELFNNKNQTKENIETGDEAFDKLIMPEIEQEENKDAAANKHEEEDNGTNENQEQEEHLDNDDEDEQGEDEGEVNNENDEEDVNDKVSEEEEETNKNEDEQNDDEQSKSSDDDDSEEKNESIEGVEVQEEADSLENSNDNDVSDKSLNDCINLNSIQNELNDSNDFLNDSDTKKKRVTFDLSNVNSVTNDVEI